MKRRATQVQGPSESTLEIDFPFLRSNTYFNSASCSPCPEPVLTAMVDFYRQNPINYRSGQTPAEIRVTEMVDAVRAKVARFIGASSPSEISFTKNTTEAINTVARGLDWKPGDEVIVTSIEHQSNLIPWMKVAREEECVITYVEPDKRGFIDPESVRSKISERTRLVSIHDVSNLLGVRQDLRSIGEIAHEHGALLLADAAQSEGRCDVDVRELGCDFLASCARKALMGPQGIGFLWGKEELLRELAPLAVGSQAAVATGHSAFDFVDIPYRHEAGILNTAGVIGLGAALEYLEEIGVFGVEAYVQSLTDELMSLLLGMEEVEVYGPQDSQRVGIISWNVKGKHPSEVAEALYERKHITVSAGLCGSPLTTGFLNVPGVVRTSLHWFNRHEDIDRLGKGLNEIV